jgi:hypothetical protein
MKSAAFLSHGSNHIHIQDWQHSWMINININNGAWAIEYYVVGIL